MSTQSIAAPFPIFTDLDGQPLEAGYIWIGVENAAPQTNPVAVYWDSALTQPAAQPIRTSNGLPLNNGSPSRLYTASGYSILVQDKRGMLVYSAPSAADLISSDLVTFVSSGTGAVTRTVESKLREWVSVKDFGAVGDGTTSDVAAFNAALAQGGTVVVPKGTYRLNGKVTMAVNGTTLRLDAGVTLLLSGVPAVQSPFGNQIHVIANDCAVIGSGPSSLLQITGGSQANAVGILHKARLTVRDLTIDGGKSGGSAFADDTFMSGVSVVATAAGGATSDANVVIDGCEIRNFIQYGVNVYGELAKGVKVVNCNIHDIGKAGDALSVGAGIVVTRGVNDFTAANNSLISNKSHGIFCSSAGLSGSQYNISNNICSSNGGHGIGFLEQLNYFSVAGQGLSRITITGNNCNANTLHGIALNCVDNVGFLSQISVVGNVCNSNSSYGILSLSNVAPNNVSSLVVMGNTTNNNTTANISISANATNVQGVAVSFTPAVRGTSTAGVGTYGSQLGTYVRNGQIVTFQIVLDWSAHTGTGNIEITGLPVAALNSEPISASWVWANGLTITGQAALTTLSNQTVATLGAINNGAFAAVAMDTAATLRISGSYFVAA